MESTSYNLPGTFLRRMSYRKTFYILKGLNNILKYVSLYGRAKKIYITAGELFPEFYNNDKLIENLESSAIGNGEHGPADIRVLFGPALYVDANKFLKFAMKYENVKLFNRSIRESAHYKVIEDVDGLLFAFLDEPHGVNEDKRETLLLTNDFRSIISPYEGEFEDKLLSAEPIVKKDLVDKFKSARKKGKRGELSGFIHKSGKREADIALDQQIENLKIELYGS